MLKDVEMSSRRHCIYEIKLREWYKADVRQYSEMICENFLELINDSDSQILKV